MQTDPHIDDSPPALRRFAWIIGGLIAVCFGLLLPWLWRYAMPAWPFALGALLALWGTVAPGSLRPVFHGWLKFGAALGWVNTRIILGAMFFLVLTPIGAVLRLFRHDPLKRRRDPDAASYRVHREPRSPEHLRKPY
ncbi:MAG: SxtJ family membrane protein [Thiotrichales bacterium]